MATMAISNSTGAKAPGRTQIKRFIYLETVIAILAEMRAEWQQAAEAEGKPLASMRGSVELILADLAEALGLDPQETERALRGKQ